MIQYETRLQTRELSRKVSFYKKDLAAGLSPQVFSLENGKLVLKTIGKITNRGKHDLLFVSIGPGKSIQCRKDTLLMGPNGWVTVEDLSVDDDLIGVRTAIQRPRTGERGTYLKVDPVIDANLEVTPIVEIRPSAIMWSGRRNDVMRVQMVDTDNFVTSTGLVVYGGKDV